jgi:hypothetical protein
MNALAAASAAAVLALAAAPASALDRLERVRATVTIEDRCNVYGTDEEAFTCRVAPRRNYTAVFFGEVRADRARCERRRRVVVFREKVKTDTFAKLGEGRADAGGAWEVRNDTKPGFVRYFAKAPRVRRGGLVCRSAESRYEWHHQ